MPLQRNFRGLNDHIGFYSGGQVPIDWIPGLQSIFDAEDFLNPADWQFNTGTLTAIGQAAVVGQVPDGEFWRVRSLTIRWSDTGSNLGVVPVWSDDGSRIFGLESFLTNQTWTAGQIGVSGLQFPQRNGFILRPSMTMGFVIRSASATPSMDFTVGVFRQRIVF